MQFASPNSLIWFGLAVPIVVFYILKIRLRRQPVSTVMFWKQVLDEQNPRSIWQRLRHLVSLLMQLAMLSLLTLAVADPFFSWEVRSARRLVIVIDNSASMNSTDIKPHRFGEAKRQADQLIAGMRHRDEIALVAAGTQPQVVVGFTSRQKTVSSAVAGLAATDGPSNVAEAIALGRRLLGERQDGKQPEVAVFSDGRFAGIEDFFESPSGGREPSGSPDAGASTVAIPATPPPSSDGSPTAIQAPVKIHVIGARSGNVGITQFQVRRSLTDPLGYEILAEVSNASDQSVECRFEVDLNAEPIDVVPLKLEAGGKWIQIFEKTSAAGGHLIARLKHEDALAADNQAVAVLPRRQIQPVLLVTSGNLFLQKVFEVNPLVKLTVVSQVPDTIPKGTVVIYHRVTPDMIPPGGAFIIDPANKTDLFTIGEQIANPIVTKQDKESPLMSHVRLDNVLMPEVRRLTPILTEQTQVLAEAVTKEPIYFAVNRPEGRVLVLTVNLDKGDLPLRTAFPITVANALHWFAGNKGDLRESLSAGSLAEVTKNDFSRPAKSSGFVLRSPLGETRLMSFNADRMTIGPLDQCGIWSILDSQPAANSQGTQPLARSATLARSASEGDAPKDAPSESPRDDLPLLEIACNLANAAESDVRSPEELLAKASKLSPVVAGFGSRPTWFWLLLVGLIVTTVEWGLYQRRIIS